ncbi:MAG: 16S rRNA (guanine(527)-N(7))-methyltransferase RsmG [Nocardioidaceae bacterium]
MFSGRLDLAEAYVARLAGGGIERGLIGPRELPRLWDRHVLNCAVVATVLPARSRVADVGSGAGLPGVVWAIARPDIQVTLIEPLRRRTDFLSELVAELGLDHQVEVWRGRAEDHAVGYRVVTARAVAALDKLARWCLPLVEPGGCLLALKGSSARQELADASSTIDRLGGTGARVTTYGEDILPVPTTVIEVDKA